MTSEAFILQAMTWLRAVDFENYRFSVRESHGGRRKRHRAST